MVAGSSPAPAIGKNMWTANKIKKLIEENRLYVFYKSKEWMAVLLVFGYFIYRGVEIFNIRNVKELFLHETALEQIYFVIQIIVGISVVLGAVIGVWQYVLTSKSERAKMKNDRVEKAINLSEYYKDNILTEVAALRFVFREYR